ATRWRCGSRTRPRSGCTSGSASRRAASAAATTRTTARTRSSCGGIPSRSRLPRPRSTTLILGIETSCDETAAAVVSDDGRVHSSVVSSQADLHARFGGVVPEIASRRHLELVGPVIREALAEADVAVETLDRVAVTQGPGLVGALLVGISTAKAIAWSRRLPLVPVDHLQGHVASLYLEPDPVEP